MESDRNSSASCLMVRVRGISIRRGSSGWLILAFAAAVLEVVLGLYAIAVILLLLKAFVLPLTKFHKYPGQDSPARYARACYPSTLSPSIPKRGTGKRRGQPSCRCCQVLFLRREFALYESALAWLLPGGKPGRCAVVYVYGCSPAV